METMIRLENVAKQFKKKREIKQVLKAVSLSICQGDFVGIVGKSGAGKTTILKIVGLLLRQDEGTLYMFEQDASQFTEKEKAQIRNKKIGFVLQDYALIDSYTVQENVEIPLNYAKEKYTRKQKREKVLDVLKQLGMESHVEDSCDKLSGGERQRVAIARALVNNPEIIIADEPTGALDGDTANEFLELLTKLNQEQKKTVLLVTHDMNMLKNCTKVYTLEKGEL